ncbi:MAG: HEAT repeat domain-containing protein [Anaerolineales bacterium]|nr:HEAT repeat domain-containing protein [Anaerolineales bacterium]
MRQEPKYQLPDEIDFSEVIEALLDDEQVFDPRYLYSFSDIRPEQLAKLKQVWLEVKVERRRALMEDLELLTETDTLLSFESVFRFALHDPDPQVRFFAIRAIEVFNTDDLIKDFLTTLKEDRDEDVRAVTASVLGKYVYRGELDKIKAELQEEIVDSLLRIINSDQPDRIRRRALEAISYSPRSEVHQQIAKAYESDNPQWVASALFAMGRSFDQRYRDQVYSRLQDTAPQVRAEAVRACGELYLEDAVYDILEMLDDIPRVRRAAIWALSQLGGEGVQRTLDQMLEDENLPAEEVKLINQALDNLAFTEGSINYSMFDLPVRDQGDEEFPDEDWSY